MTNNLPTVTDFQNAIEVSNAAPPPPAWMFDENASIDDLVASKFLSMESLSEWLKDRRAQARILTVKGLTAELLYDPSKGETEKDGEWKPVLWFSEIESGLVLNKTRSFHMKRLTNSPLAKAGRVVALTVGVHEGKAQIGIEAPPMSKDEYEAAMEKATASLYDVDDFNADFFGE